MYRFHHNIVDTQLFRQLQDLSTVLSGVSDLTFTYRFGSYIDIVDREVTASRMWDKAKFEYRVAGLKTDVYLRTIGTLSYTDVRAVQQYVEALHRFSLPKFGRNLFALLEDIRLEEQVKQERPGTKNVFLQRKAYLKHQFDKDRAAHVTRGLALDELFCLIYLRLQSDVAEPSFSRASEEQLDQLKRLAANLYEVFEAKSTSDIARICEQMLQVLSETSHYDMIHDYFVLPIRHVHTFAKNTLFDELTRTDPLENDDKEELDEDKNEYIDETFSTWHRENENSDRKQTFLQFELEVGTKTNMKGNGARETEDGDQAMGTIQGAAGQTKNKDYSDLESLDKQENKQGKRAENVYGEENKDAVKLLKQADVPTKSEVELYEAYVKDVEPYKRKLENILKKTIEHKQNAPRTNIMAGRLSRKLLPIVLDEKPRIFYKKNEKSKEFDAAFTLLIDCSASMQGKMEETKRGVTLFHEVLKAFQIPHSIIGFWEDAMEVKEHYQPNYFHVIHAFTDSFYERNGPKIMQLEPQEDNRDGFSIRVATEELAVRREKNKFLLVFSDGEPAAANYNQNGIVDTNLAVMEARKQGIEVIGTFLADGEIGELEDHFMQNIYGRERILVPNVAELPEHFAPLMKKLLLKAL